MLAGGAGTTVGAPRGFAWPELGADRGPLVRAGMRLAMLRRSVAIARRTLRGQAAGADAPTLVRRQAFGLTRLFAEICATSGVQIAVSGPIPQGPVVMVANHVGYLDAIVLASLVPCAPVAKREVAGWPWLGAVGRQHGVLFVERGDAWSGARALRRAGRVLASGISVLNFPEGTTTEGDAILPFRRGIFGVARHAGVPVVPVALGFDDPELAWTGGSLFLPHFLRTLARREIVARVRFGCAMTPARYGGADDLAREARAVVEHLLYGA